MILFNRFQKWSPAHIPPYKWPKSINLRWHIKSCKYPCNKCVIQHGWRWRFKITASRPQAVFAISNTSFALGRLVPAWSFITLDSIASKYGMTAAPDIADIMQLWKVSRLSIVFRELFILVTPSMQPRQEKIQEYRIRINPQTPLR